MYSAALLKTALYKPGLSRKDALLIILGVEGKRNRTVGEIRALAEGAGFRKVKKWNISDILTRAPGLAIHTGSGWELTEAGKMHVANVAGVQFTGAVARRTSSNLRRYLGNIPNRATRAFVDEAIVCFEMKQYRAAVVFSWIGAVAVLYEHVLNNSLRDFNIEAQRRHPSWKTAKSFDDLALMGEYDFLQVLQSISVLGKSVKQQLERGLVLRNGCGHPNNLQIGEKYCRSTS
ncbi:MAG: hypothetical protein V3U35_05575 [Candidatus Neomarinimicrobiota bacterium]